MKKILISFLLGIIFCIVVMVVLVANLLFGKKEQTSPVSPTHTQNTENQTQQSTTQNGYVITGQIGSYNEQSYSSNDQNESHSPSSLPQNHKVAIAKGELSAVHGRGGRGHLRVVPSHLTKKEEWVHANAYNALLSLIHHAKQDGISLSVVSAYRSYDHQKRIWERKWGDKANDDVNQALSVLEYSSFPGTSRHHWGTDIDFNSVSLSYWQSDEGKKVHRWLSKNAPQYGFCQTYGNNRTTGYAVEDWHWSHMPTARQYYEQINNPQVLQIAISQSVKGAEAVRLLDEKIFEYVRGISPCNVNENATVNDEIANHQTVSSLSNPSNQFHSQSSQLPSHTTNQNTDFTPMPALPPKPNQTPPSKISGAGGSF